MLLNNFISVLYLQYSLQDGAEIGYGAKAQEILGQVRGRYVLLPYYVYIDSSDATFLSFSILYIFH